MFIPAFNEQAVGLDGGPTCDPIEPEPDWLPLGHELICLRHIGYFHGFHSLGVNRPDERWFLPKVTRHGFLAPTDDDELVSATDRVNRWLEGSGHEPAFPVALYLLWAGETGFRAFLNRRGWNSAPPPSTAPAGSARSTRS